MITVYPETGKPVWVDLQDPTPEEITRASAEYGLEIPPRAELEEIEFSSRLQFEDGVFVISVPVTATGADGESSTSPLGFVLTSGLLVTIHFAELHTFESIRQRVRCRERSSADIFMVILEAMIDFGADRLEELRASALVVSRRIFHKQMQKKRKRNVAGASQMLRATLVEIGDMSERLSQIRETLLVMQRAIPFLIEHGNGWIATSEKVRLKMGLRDVRSLNEYEGHLTDKLQFLLDAALGFISTEQNDLFKVLTIASVVGIPPVLMAGIWGMNFHGMPELDWAYGYPLAWGVILLSGLLPLLWFKWRGWW